MPLPRTFDAADVAMRNVPRQWNHHRHPEVYFPEEQGLQAKWMTGLPGAPGPIGKMT